MQTEPLPPGPMPQPPADRSEKLRALAVDMEAAFLSEMLACAGFGEPSESFGGGAGERQFASFLRDEQAAGIARSGGIGLAESLFRALSGTRT